MTALDLAAIRALADKATPGPWEWTPDACSEDGATYTPNRVWTDGGFDPFGEAQDDYVLAGGISNEDAAFIAAVRDVVPMLLDEIDRLRALLDGTCEARVSWGQCRMAQIDAGENR